MSPIAILIIIIILVIFLALIWNYQNTCTSNKHENFEQDNTLVAKPVPDLLPKYTKNGQVLRNDIIIPNDFYSKQLGNIKLERYSEPIDNTVLQNIKNNELVHMPVQKTGFNQNIIIIIIVILLLLFVVYASFSAINETM